MAVYAYLRVSTDKQDGQNQRLGVDEFAKKRGWVIDEYIDDEGKSGTLEPEKRELGDLLKKLKKGDTLIAGEISRLGRSLFMIMRILEYCMNNEIKVFTVKDGYELGNNITSKVLAFAFGLSAEIERDMIARRVTETLQKKKKDGMILGRPHGTMWGGYKLRGKETEVKKMIDSKMRFNQIAKTLNVSKDTVQKFAKEHGWVSLVARGNNSRKRILEDKYDVIKELIEAGFTTKEIQQKLNLKYSTVLTDFMAIHKELIQLYQDVQAPIRLKANKHYIKNKTLNFGRWDYD